MNSILLIAASVTPAFLLGYGLCKFVLDWKTKASRAKVEADLQAEQLAATVTASLDGIIIIDSDGRVVEFSESAERIFGYEKTNVLGKPMADLIVPERYRDAHNNGMARMRETGQANILGQRIEIEALRANGEEFMSELAISRSRSSKGDIFIAYIRDISKAKAAEKALRDAKEEAELANKAKTQFISSMSHEIRTPFNAVLGILEILGDTRLSKDQKQLVRTADRTSRSLLRIINDVLDYARISSGSVKIMNEAFYAADVFDDIYRLFSMQAKERNIRFNIDNSAADNIHLSGDIGRIRQILMNFVSNAIKYTKDGTIDLIVQTQRETESEYSLICKVKDTGLGISDDKQKHLFEEFYMAEEVDVRATEGTGLGLTICKVLTIMMGGTIGVESKPAMGSTFWINLPLQKTNAVSPQMDISTQHHDINGKQVLLVEDNPTNRMVVTRILEKQGAILTVATNGIEALKSLDVVRFDLLLTDVFMPEMGGKELVERLRTGDSPNAKIPVIALTAMGDIHEAEELLNYGVNQVILKPFDSKELIKAIVEQCSTACLTNAAETMPLKDYEDIEISMSGGMLDGLDANDLQAIKGQFKADLIDVSGLLDQAIKARDITATKAASHTLKGLAGIYGLSTLSDTAKLTNSNCSDDTIDKMVEYGTRAIEIANVVILKLNALFGSHEEAA